MKINFRFFFVSFLGVVILSFFSSCFLSPELSHKFSDVDFSKRKKIQITYNELIYNADIQFNGRELVFEYCGDAELICGTRVTVDSDTYNIYHSGMTFDGVSGDLPSVFLPTVIYNLFADKGSVIRLESFNEDKSCFYSSFSVNEHFITVELYEGEENNQSVAMTIT